MQLYAFWQGGTDGEKKTDMVITGNLKHAQSQEDDRIFVLSKVNTDNQHFQFSKSSLRQNNSYPRCNGQFSKTTSYTCLLVISDGKGGGQSTIPDL